MHFWSLVNKLLCILYGLPLILGDESYPNPSITSNLAKNETNICNNYDIPTICDPSDELTKEQKTNLNLTINQIRTSYTCTPCLDCGNSKQLMVGIAIANNLSENTISYEEDLVLSILELWKLSNCANDIIILASNSTKKVYLAVGSQASNHLLSECSIKIAEISSEKMKSSNLYESLVIALSEIKKRYYNPSNGSITADQTCSKKTEDHFILKPEIIFLIALSGVIVLGLIAFGIYHLRGVRRNRALNYRPEFTSFYNPSVTIDRSKMGTNDHSGQPNEMRTKTQLDEDGYQEVDLGHTNTGYSM